MKEGLVSGAAATDDPEGLFDQLEAMLKAAGIPIPTDLERARRATQDAWKLRSTTTLWDWKPAAKHIKSWLESFAAVENVWMEKRAGSPIRLKFQMRDMTYVHNWPQGRFKTLRSQLHKKFGMEPSSVDEGLYTLSDGTPIEVKVFLGGTPGPNSL